MIPPDPSPPARPTERFGYREPDDAAPAPEAGREPQCWHTEIGDEGICKACGARAAIKLPFTSEDVRQGRMHTRNAESVDMLRISNAIEETDPTEDYPSLEWQIGHMTGVVEAYRKNQTELESRLSTVVEALRELVYQLDLRYYVGPGIATPLSKARAILRDFPQEPKP